MAENLAKQKCRPCKGGTPPLPPEEISRLLDALPGWGRSGNTITKVYPFNDYYQTMAFVNAVAWIAHREDHHPDLSVSYNQCRIVFSTHSINGLSQNDFICAAKIEALFNL